MMPIRTIAVGFDGSPDATAAVRWTLELANQLGANVTFVHAAGLLEHFEERRLLSDLEETAGCMTGEAGLAPTRGRWHCVDGAPCSALLRAAEPPISADLLVVG